MKQLFCVFAFLFLVIQGFSQNFELVEPSLIHEGFVTQEYGQILQHAIPQRPPNRISEQVPHQTDLLLIWLPGYWKWSKTHDEFIWVSGVWRKPPPGHEWVSGYWKEYEQGWVWMRGFWSPVTQQNLFFIREHPPENINEHVSRSPQQSEGYFWAPGYWHYDKTRDDFRWMSGRWDHLQEKWVLVPGHYEWRDEGYVEIPPYWDYPVVERGAAFPAVHIVPEDRETIVYLPKGILHPLYIMEILYPEWPSYQCLFYHHFMFYNSAWHRWGTIPPWWDWGSWWTLPYHENLALWWWWSHSNYPNPIWLTEELADQISPPAPLVFKIMDGVEPPANVTFRGVVSVNQLINAIQEVSGLWEPIVPYDVNELREVQKKAIAKTPRKPYLKPRGLEEVGGVVAIPAKPSDGPTPAEMKYPPQRLIIPPIPAIEYVPKLRQAPPPIKPVERSQTVNLVVTERVEYPPWHEGEEAPFQGGVIDYEYPQVPRQSESHDGISSYPHPLRNAPAPRAHPTPGDYSTGSN